MSSISQQAIASALGVSTGTVSRSLSNDPAISDETRARVLRKAEDLGYDFTRVTRRRTVRRNLTVGVLIGVRDTVAGTAAFPSVLKGIQDRALREGVSVEVCFQNPDTFNPDLRGNEVHRRIRAGNWRGAILIYPYPEPAIRSLTRQFPVVAALEDYVDLGVDSVDTDHGAGVRALMDRLVEAGHRRIGFVGWPYAIPGHWTQQRYSAYLVGLHRHGLVLQPEFALNAAPHLPVCRTEVISDRVAHLVCRKQVTAWVCAADHQAYPLIYDLQMRGLQLPEECSVTGYDGIPPPARMKQVATVRVPHEEIGATALLRLLHRISRPEDIPAKILLRAEVCAGESIGPGPASAGARAAI